MHTSIDVQPFVTNHEYDLLHLSSDTPTEVNLTDVYFVVKKLNLFTSQSGPLKPAFISGFCSVEQMRVIDSTPNPSQVSPQQKLVLILPTP